MTSRPNPSSLVSKDIFAISRDVLWVSGTLICYDIKKGTHNNLTFEDS